MRLFNYIFVCFLFLTGCENKEQEARITLNQAIKAWQAEDFIGAESKFDEIDTLFGSTSTAIEAYKIRQSLEKEQHNSEAYELYLSALGKWHDDQIREAELDFNTLEQDYGDTQASLKAVITRTDLKREYRQKVEGMTEDSVKKNRGRFSRQVVRGIQNYYKQHASYPADLSVLDISAADRRYIDLCQYEPALFDYGYWLDCNAAEQTYLVSQRQQTSRQPTKRRNKDAIYKLEDFSKATKTWGSKLNPTGKVPKQGFSAYYLNTNNPGTVISKAEVKSIGINYSYSDFHDINSKDFGAYWVGKTTVDQATIKTITVSQSWAKTRLLINGAIVYEGGSDQEIQVQFEPGEYLIEVEYVNNWHTTEFSVNFLDTVKKLSLSEIGKELQKQISGKYAVYYAGVYESKSQDLGIDVNVGRIDGPMVLFLSSYSTINWNINNTHKADIKAIVYGSYSPGTRVTGDIPASALLLNSKKRLGNYRKQANCRCTGGSRFHCEGSSIMPTIKSLESLTKNKVAGFSGAYSTSAIPIPQEKIEPSFMSELERAEEEKQRARLACEKGANPDFESLLD